jgi:hypothetical protein
MGGDVTTRVRLFALLARLDLAGAGSLCAADCVYGDVPYPQATVTGPAAIAAKLEHSRPSRDGNP